MRSPLRYLRRNRLESALAASRSRDRREVLEALERKQGSARLVALCPSLARRVFGHTPEPGARFVGVPMILDPSLPRFGFRVHAYGDAHPSD